MTGAVPAQKVKNLKKPGTLALDRASLFVTKGGNHPAQVRRAFIRSNTGERPPLARIISGGGETRLKLYLSLLLVCKWTPHETEIQAQRWAELLGLAVPRTHGARRISDAFNWLEKSSFVLLRRRHGLPHLVRILNDDGSGEPYLRPYDRDDPYLQIPTSFWTAGWVEVLSAPAVAALLILLDQQWLSGPKDLWISGSIRKRWYGISEDTLYRGVSELHRYGVISKTLRPQGDLLQVSRIRNIYRLNLNFLELGPTEPS